MEEWREVIDNPNYQVSNTGRVRRNGHNKDKAVRVANDGYLKTDLYMDGKRKTKRINRIVAQAFIPNPENKPEVNHKDGNKLNNNVSNLEWNTKQRWIADYIDLTRGKYVQRVWQKTFDGSDDEKWTRYDSDEGYEGFAIITLPESMKARVGLCNKFSIQTDWNNEVEGVWFGSPASANTTLYCKSSSFYDNTLDDKGLANFKANLAEHPMNLMTYLDEPIERDLTTEEIAAYKELITYNNAETRIATNQNVTMSAKYPKRYSTTI